jgi:hypothetical protein
MRGFFPFGCAQGQNDGLGWVVLFSGLVWWRIWGWCRGACRFWR